MCGLVGVFSKNQNGFSKDQQELFNTLLYVDFLRGQDSTGAFSISNQGEVLLCKEASTPAAFQNTKEYKELMQRLWANGAAAIGHNRKATRGVVNDENAHPFVVDDNIVLVHNGTMFGDHKKIADVEVDSHAIAHAIHENGDVAKALSSFDAAYALIWYDFKQRKVNIIRNAHRPLWWVETSTSWLWSSERSMLEFAIARNDLVIIKDGPHELPENTLQTYSLDNKKWELSSEELKITRHVPSYGTPTPGWNQHRSQPHAQWPRPAWMEDEDGDVPFVTRGDKQTNNVILMPGQTAELDRPGTTGHYEREMAQREGKLVSNQEYHDDVIPSYPHGTSVVARSFDYCFANQKDEKGGYYLYCSVVDNPEVMVRQYFDSKYMTEERIMAIASGEYVYRFKVGRKRWAALAPGSVVSRSMGYTILESEKASLLSGGGIVSGVEEGAATPTVH